MSLENKRKIGPKLFSSRSALSQWQGVQWVEAGGVSPPAPRQFFTFQVLNGAILALFFIFLPFLLKK